MAIIGNFRNFLTPLETYSTLGIQNGVVKYVGESHKNNQQLSKVLSTVFITMLAGILVLSLALYFTSGYVNILIFGNNTNYNHIFKITALSLPWFGGNVILLAIVNGLGFYREVIKINIVANIAGVALTALLVYKLNITGAMLALLFSPAFIFIMSLHYIYRHFTGLPFFSLGNFDVTILKGLLNYSLMTLVTALLGPVVYISIRNTIIQHFSADEAGYWDTMQRISLFYLMFVTTLISVYFFPKLTQAKDKAQTKKVFTDYYKLIIPLYLAGSIVLFLCKGFVIEIMASGEFLPVTRLFGWQLLGDLFKVGALILGYEFFAKKMTKAFIITEVISYVILYFTGTYLTQLYGSEGAVMAHAVTHFIYLTILTIYFKYKSFI